MVTEEGVVQQVINDKAIVRIQRNSCCAGCHSESACRPSETKEMVVEAINSLDAHAGDRVRISLPTGAFLKVSFVVYFIPVVVLILGAAAGNHFAPAMGVDAALASIFAGGLSMALAFVAVKWFDRGANAKEQYWPRVTRILPPAETPPFCNK